MRYFIRYALCLLIVLLTLLALRPLSLRLVSGLHLLSAGNRLDEGYYGLAVETLKKAEACVPGDYRIPDRLGDAYFRMSESRGMRAKEPLVRKSAESYKKAHLLNPLDAGAAYGLARAQYLLESLDPQKENSRHNALPWFKETLRLRPNSILYNYALARYLLYRGDEKELLTVLDNMARIYPSAYYRIRREPFWPPSAGEAMKSGLEQALQEGVAPKEAHRALSSLYADEKNWEQAVVHYRKALAYRTFDNRAADFIHLGRLYLKSGEKEKAEENFLKALNRSPDREKDVNRIYRIYKGEDLLEEFAGFYAAVGNRFALSPGMGMTLARSLMDSERYDRAAEALMDVNRKDPTAGACYLLARIAEKQKDWDSMELFIQKATVLDPDNGSYHLIFSQVLKRLKKLERAEKEAGLALQLQDNPSPWTFNLRAGLRWDLEDYEGAAKDWKIAAGLKPDHATFYAQAAEAYTRLAYWPLAEEYYKKALDLDPKNERYKKRYRQLTVGRSEVSGQKSEIRNQRSEVRNQ